MFITWWSQIILWLLLRFTWLLYTLIPVVQESKHSLRISSSLSVLKLIVFASLCYMYMILSVQIFWQIDCKSDFIMSTSFHIWRQTSVKNLQGVPFDCLWDYRWFDLSASCLALTYALWFSVTKIFCFIDPYTT